MAVMVEGRVVLIPGLGFQIHEFNNGATKDNAYDSTHNGNDKLGHIYFRVIYDNPELCNGVPNFGWTIAGDGGVSLLCVPKYSDAEVAFMRNTCNETKAEVQALIYQTTGARPHTELTPKQKSRVAKVVHDWLVLHNRYDVVNEDETIDQTMYPALSKYANDPVCASYAFAFNWLCEPYGIESIFASGAVYSGVIIGDVPQIRGYHAWNLVNFEDDYGNYDTDSANWTIVDCTWDDPTSQGDNYIQWNYFCKASSQLVPLYGLNSREKDTRAYTYPAASEECRDYNYNGNTPYVWEED